MKLIIKENSSEFYDTLKLEDIPDDLPSQINVIKKGGLYGFKVGNIVGVVPLNNNLFISIDPKYENLNVFEMILYIEGIKNKLSDPASTNFLQLGSTRSLNNFFLEKFVEELITINSKSLKFARKKVNENQDSIRGKVNWKNTKLNMKKKISSPIEASIYKSIYAIPENIILSSAASIVLNYFPPFSKEWEILNEWATKFPTLEINNIMRIIETKLSEDKISGSRSYYRDAIITAKIILDFYGIKAGETIAAKSILLNTPDIYEKYIRKACQIKANEKGILVQKGFFPSEFLLEEEIELIPDLLFYNSEKVLAVGDIKYKEPSPSDFHQLYCYLRKAECSTGILFTPKKNGELTPTITKKTTYDDLTFYIIEVPNSGIHSVYESIDSLFTNNII